MIKQVFHIERYWKVIVYYNVDYDYFDIIAKDLRLIGTPIEEIDIIYNNLLTNAYGVTITNSSKRTSVVLFNIHKFKSEYISTIIHEAEHIKQAILKYYNVPDKGEDAAYTIGYISKRMFDVVRYIVCRE